MTEVVEKQQPSIVLNEDYRVVTDGSRNVILQKKYQLRSGKGKNAPLIEGAYDYKDVSYHGSSISSLAHRLNEIEVLESFDTLDEGESVVKALEDMKKFLDEREQRIYTYFTEKIELKLGNVKVKVEDE